MKLRTRIMFGIIGFLVSKTCYAISGFASCNVTCMRPTTDWSFHSEQSVVSLRQSWPEIRCRTKNFALRPLPATCFGVFSCRTIKRTYTTPYRYGGGMYDFWQPNWIFWAPALTRIVQSGCRALLDGEAPILTNASCSCDF